MGRKTEKGAGLCYAEALPLLFGEKEKVTDGIESFQVDHTRLLPGIYVSRVDRVGNETVTTYDVRMKAPNREAPLSTAATHTIEHIGATFLRLETDAPVIYFGPMGCRTGFYLVIHGEPYPLEMVELIRGLFHRVLSAESIPGATEVECGNAADHDLQGAKEEAAHFLDTTLDRIHSANDPRLNYPK